jgi:pimeloyl-ACP methyl ester carboxylesterase
MIGGKRIADMERILPNLKPSSREAGHWVQQEGAAEVNAALIAFLSAAQ